MSQTVFSSSGRLSCSALWWYLQYSITLMRIFESTMGSGTGASRPVSSTMFFTVIDRHATSFSTSKISSCLDFSFTDVDSAEQGADASQHAGLKRGWDVGSGVRGPSVQGGTGRTSIIRHVFSACLFCARTGECKRESKLRRGGNPSRGPACGLPRASQAAWRWPSAAPARVAPPSPPNTRRGRGLPSWRQKRKTDRGDNT